MAIVVISISLDYWAGIKTLSVCKTQSPGAKEIDFSVYPLGKLEPFSSSPKALRTDLSHLKTEK